VAGLVWGACGDGGDGAAEGVGVQQGPVPRGESWWAVRCEGGSWAEIAIEPGHVTRPSTEASG
jgi:hypothetical protein